MKTSNICFNESEYISSDKTITVKFYIKEENIFYRAGEMAEEIQHTSFLFNGSKYKSKWLSYEIDSHTVIKREIIVENKKHKAKKTITYFKLDSNELNYYENILGNVVEITKFK
jgi:hypothetical protein